LIDGGPISKAQERTQAEMGILGQSKLARNIVAGLEAGEVLDMTL
jgi:hypothetical protein